jgi:hypothetical protein
MAKKNTKIYWDDISMVPFAIVNSYSDKTNLWISYEDIKSARRKADYVKKNNLGGVAIMSLDNDDFKSKFCNLGSFPIVDAIRAEFDKTAALNPDERLETMQKITIKYENEQNKPNGFNNMTYKEGEHSTKMTLSTSKGINQTTKPSFNRDEIFEILKKFKGVRQLNIITKLDHIKNNSLKQNISLTLSIFVILSLTMFI